MTTGTYRPDQAAVDWARGCVERSGAQLRAFAVEAEARGDEAQAHTWRTAAFSMETALIGRGCVIGPFNERAVVIADIVDAAGDRVVRYDGGTNHPKGSR